jgi:hypothetical protein
MFTWCFTRNYPTIILVLIVIVLSLLFITFSYRLGSMVKVLSFYGHFQLSTVRYCQVWSFLLMDSHGWNCSVVKYCQVFCITVQYCPLLSSIVTLKAHLSIIPFSLGFSVLSFIVIPPWVTFPHVCFNDMPFLHPTTNHITLWKHHSPSFLSWSMCVGCGGGNENIKQTFRKLD